MPYDPDSGLVFRETIIKKPSDLRGDSIRCAGRPPVPRTTGNGAGSLFSIALRKLLCNLDMLDSSSLSTIPEDFIEMIWKAILER